MNPTFYDFLKNFIYFRERAQAGGAEDGEAGSSLSREPEGAQSQDPGTMTRAKGGCLTN